MTNELKLDFNKVAHIQFTDEEKEFHIQEKNKVATILLSTPWLDLEMKEIEKAVKVYEYFHKKFKDIWLNMLGIPLEFFPLKTFKKYDYKAFLNHYFAWLEGNLPADNPFFGLENALKHGVCD